LHRSYCAQQAHSQHLELNEKAEELLKQLGLSQAAAELAGCNKVIKLDPLIVQANQSLLATDSTRGMCVQESEEKLRDLRARGVNLSPLQRDV
jgi:hypothetical protein